MAMLLAVTAGALLDFSVESYCEFLQSNPEPDLLFYNRMPKTGSTSVINELREAAHRHGSTSRTLDLNQSYWLTDFMTKFEDTSALIRSHGKRAQYLSIVGHIPHPDIVASDVGGKRMEFINTMRSCVDRLTSSTLYPLVGDMLAVARTESEQEEFLQKEFQDVPNSRGSDYAACFEDPVCAEAYLTKKNGSHNFTAAYFMCGDTKKYWSSSRDCVVDKLFEGMNPTGHNAGYTAIGLTEHMEDSLELFQCAFPSYFTGALPKRSNVNKKREEFSALKKVIATRCDDGEAEYAIAKLRFFKILAHIRGPKGRTCCRSRRDRGQSHDESSSGDLHARHLWHVPS